MIKNLAIVMCITMVNSITLNLNEICYCSQLIQEWDCNDSLQGCIWDSKSQVCQEIPCSELSLPKFCQMQPQRCYWNQNIGCLNFTDCSSLKGSSQSSCIEQNIYCPASNGTNCQSINYLQTCSSITTPDNCNNYFSATGLCMWNGKNCIQATSCQQLWSNSTPSCDFRGCYLNNETQQCLPKICSQIQSELQCYGILTFGPYLNNVIGCFWNYQLNGSSGCQEFSPQLVMYANCDDSSLGTYHWNSNKEQGQCVPCFQKLLFLSIVITILF
ncbi:unnamed protein product [Paramecium sonneborni]|uniref:Uncharacterized protein n=1 Tax=Paramecium sonneborni TaxID=65129 RepID=A0A8S1QLV0_9CILI|nr:unnamed protein product [Paramecium sonneborni]